MPRLRALAALAVAAMFVVTGTETSSATDPEWNVARVGGPRAANGGLIAVVDTGVDGSHPALRGRVLEAIDLVDGSGGDPNGHGTHVAGTAAGADLACGSIGVAPDARILPVRVLDEDGTGSVDAAAAGIEAAADAGAWAINVSLAEQETFALRGLGGSRLADAIEYAWNKGSVPVLAAGNQSDFVNLFGSGYQSLPAIVVTATDVSDRAPDYASPVGDAQWAMAAPGGDGSGELGRDIRSSFPDLNCALSAGTSMAAPHVSAAVVVLRSHGLTPQETVDRLLETARDLGDPQVYGAGLLDLTAALPQPSTTTTPVTNGPATSTTSAPASTSTVPSTTGSTAPESPDTTGSSTTAPVPSSSTANDVTAATDTVASPERAVAPEALPGATNPGDVDDASRSSWWSIVLPAALVVLGIGAFVLRRRT